MFKLTPWRKKDNGGREVSPWGDQALTRMRDEVESLFDRFLGHWPRPFSEGWGRQLFWGLDVDETDKEVVVRAEAPGFEAQDFDVQVTGNVLTIRAEHKEESEAKPGEPQTLERRHFQRTITLPPGTDTQNVDARYRNGVLELHLPKTPEAQGRRIDVKT